VSTEKPVKAFIGLGSNLNNKEENLKNAIKLIDGLDLTKVVKVSSFYKTSPVGNVDQDWFLNAAIEISTSIPPDELLTALLGIENRMGRVRKEKWGARIIDLDILFYDDVSLNEGDLTIPHPNLHERKFVLEPMKEIAPDYIHLVYKKSISMLYDELNSDEEVLKI
jgi:2-amino-4-hydroxy-6-hydroxymethyldihydropteridine diphosphokinase